LPPPPFSIILRQRSAFGPLYYRSPPLLLAFFLNFHGKNTVIFLGISSPSKRLVASSPLFLRSFSFEGFGLGAVLSQFPPFSKDLWLPSAGPPPPCVPFLSRRNFGVKAPISTFPVLFLLVPTSQSLHSSDSFFFFFFRCRCRPCPCFDFALPYFASWQVASCRGRYSPVSEGWVPYLGLFLQPFSWTLPPPPLTLRCRDTLLSNSPVLPVCVHRSFG